MRKRPWSIALISVALISACVTINVYFPAAEAQQAAKAPVILVVDQAAQRVHVDGFVHEVEGARLDERLHRALVDARAVDARAEVEQALERAALLARAHNRLDRLLRFIYGLNQNANCIDFPPNPLDMCRNSLLILHFSTETSNYLNSGLSARCRSCFVHANAVFNLKKDPKKSL